MSSATLVRLMLTNWRRTHSATLRGAGLMVALLIRSGCEFVPGSSRSVSSAPESAPALAPRRRARCVGARWRRSFFSSC